MAAVCRVPDVWGAAQGLCSGELGAHGYRVDAVVGCGSARATRSCKLLKRSSVLSSCNAETKHACKLTRIQAPKSSA